MREGKDGMLKVSNINVKFEDKEIFKNANFLAYPNELTVVTGQSGSGKTTLFDILRKERNDYEEYQVDNQNNFYRITAMTQDNIFIDDLTVSQHIGMFQKTEFIERITNELDIFSFYKKKIKELSGGERQRLSFLLSIMQNSYILLCDEPTASLNQNYAQSLCDFLLEYAKKGHIVIIMTHDDIIIKHADSLYQIENSQLVLKYSDFSYPLTKHSDKKIISLPFKTYIYLLFNKKINILMTLLISLSIALLSFSFSYGNLSQYYYDQELSLTNQTAIVYKEILPNEFSSFSFYEEPLTKHEISKLKNIKGIKDVWALYVGTQNFYVQMEEQQTPLKQFKLYKNDSLIQEMTYDETETGYSDVTYNDNFDYSHDPNIYKKFNNPNGVYITTSLLDKLGIDIDVLDENCELEFPIRVPQYTILNYARFVSNDGSLLKYGCVISAKLQTIRLKISGILNTSSFSLGINSLMTDDAVFYPLNIAEQYIQMYHVTETKKFTSIYDNQVYQAIPFEAPYYIISFDDNADYDAIIESLNDIGLSYDSRYIYNSTLVDSLVSVRYQIVFVALGLFVLLSVLYIIIQMNQKKTLNTFYQFFKHLGLSMNEIKKININKIVCDMIFKIILSCLFAIIIIQCSQYLTLELTIFDIKTSLMVITMIVLWELITYALIQKGKRYND